MSIRCCDTISSETIAEIFILKSRLVPSDAQVTGAELNEFEKANVQTILAWEAALQ